MSRHGEGEFYASILAEIFEVVTCELRSVVSDNLLRDSQADDQICPQKLSYLEVGFSAEGFCLNPFREIVDHN